MITVKNKMTNELQETFNSVAEFIKSTNLAIEDIETDNFLKQNELGRVHDLQSAINTWIDWDYTVTID